MDLEWVVKDMNKWMVKDMNNEILFFFLCDIEHQKHLQHRIRSRRAEMVTGLNWNGPGQRGSSDLISCLGMEKFRLKVFYIFFCDFA